jgi:hypothetical protein
MKETLDIRPSPRLLQVLGDIPLQYWQCLAELIDNSLDELIKGPGRTTDNPLRIDISVETSNGFTYVVVKDNGSGMREDELEKALRAGHSSKGRYGTLGLFGMGFNIATARLGEVTVVETRAKDRAESLAATIDFAELQKKESFTIPLRRSAGGALSTGTTVRIRLKRDVATAFQRPQIQHSLIRQLGDVYSFLLRDSVPGITSAVLSARVPAVLTFNGIIIEPVLPCIWSDKRLVTSAGSDVCAVQYIDNKLAEATACLDCGYWDRKNGPDRCEECGSARLELRERRIWGWLGVQRYIDSSHYGIDFLRYGRKILLLDKSIFSYLDPDTLESTIEYPIEMPANQGRLVGEIHLDHVPVTYQKNDFNRQSRDWQTAIEVLRGAGPLKPRGAAVVNNSPMAKIYSAFRRNDPGLRYLTAGDGKQAIHSKSKEWASYFSKGVARYRDDSEWYESAARHAAIKDGVTQGNPNNDATLDGEKYKSLDPIKKYLGEGAGVTPNKPVAAPQKKVLTEQEVLERARMVGTVREDLSMQFNLGLKLGSYNVSVVTTKKELTDAVGDGPVPAKPGQVSALNIEVFVFDEHEIFRDYGRDIRDVALLKVAEIIKGLTQTPLTCTTIYSELVKSIPDLRITDALISERATRIFERIRERMAPVITLAPDEYWGLLDSDEKTNVEHRALSRAASVSLPDLIASGQFIKFVGADGLKRWITARPELFFGGVVFLPLVSGRAPTAIDRIVGNIVRDVDTLFDFQSDSLRRSKHDVALALITLDHLESQIADEDV